MSITLGGVQLPDNMILEDELNWTGVAASSEMTLGGEPVIWEDAVAGGRPIDLVAYEDMGWLTRDQVLAVRALASTPGWVGTLSYEGATYRVRFRHEDPPAIDVEPLIPRPNPDSGDYYYGRIKLMEV
jgi:hypothetical protein